MIIQGVTLDGTYVIDHPPLITTGLQQYFDIGNASSYSGTGTTLTDLSGSGRGNGAITAGVTYTAAGVNNGSSYLTFNGSTTYAQTANLINMVNATLNVTLEVWIRTSTDNGVVISEQGTVPFNSGWHDAQIVLASGNVRMAVWPYAGGGVAEGVTVGAVTRNVWQQYTLSYNAATSTLTGYINGATSNSYSIARNFGGGVLYYAIALADVTSIGDTSALACDWSIFRVYNRALSAAEVLQNYQADSWRYVS